MIHSACRMACCVVAAFLLNVFGNVSSASPVRYIVEGDYGNAAGTSVNVRGGSFRISADFLPTDLSSSTAMHGTTSAGYINSGITVETFGTVNDMNTFFPVPASLFVAEVIGLTDRATLQIGILTELIPFGVPVEFFPVFIITPFGISFFDQSIVSGDPLGIPIFDESDIGIFPTEIPGFDFASVTVRAVAVPEPSSLAMLAIGAITIARRVRACTHLLRLARHGHQ